MRPTDIAEIVTSHLLARSEPVGGPALADTYDSMIAKRRVRRRSVMGSMTFLTGSDALAAKYGV